MQKFKKDTEGCSKLNAEVPRADLIITDNTAIKPEENVTHEPSAVMVAAILNECPIYSRATVVGKLYSISRTALSMKKSQLYKECKIVDDTNVVRTITFLIQLI